MYLGKSLFAVSMAFALSALSASAEPNPANVQPSTKPPAHQATLPGIDKPFKPTAMLMVSLENTNLWAELYSMSKAEVPAAIQRAINGDAPAEQLTAAVADWSLHLSSGNRSFVMPEQEYKLTRDGRQIDYADCVVTPLKGDKIELTYRTNDGSHTAKLSAVVQEYLSYSSSTNEMLDVKVYEQCMKETHSRMFLHGSLVLTKKGHPSPIAVEEVLVQSIVEPE